MRLTIRPRPPRSTWHKWFAWHPVMISLPDGGTQFIWLETVERQRMSNNVGSWYVYSTLRAPEHQPTWMRD